tara:strand:- start:230 stop:427 length:198 start_codon:yes stop_codon:yes gene_type:complete
MYAKYERKKMVQFIQKIVDAFRVPSLAYGDNFDNVDPNLVRYFRTEYGRDWEGALSEHLHKTTKK